MGRRKLTYNFVKESFEKEGYTLLSKEYKNAKTKLSYICSNGHNHSIAWGNWQSGQRCTYCSHNAPVNIKSVRKSFVEEGYTLLTYVYINNNTKLDYICSEGHEHSITWNNWKTGFRCPYCAGLKIITKDIKNAFSKEGYFILSEYINSNTYLNYICPIGHNHSIVWDNWKQGKRCPTCANIKMSGPGNPAWRGGVSFEPYCEAWKDKEYKQHIKERDGFTCMNPDCWKKDILLVIHHIDYNKKNCKPSNLITVCNSCNSRANKDREWHEAWYKAIMYRRYKI